MKTYMHARTHATIELKKMPILIVWNREKVQASQKQTFSKQRKNRERKDHHKIKPIQGPLESFTLWTKRLGLSEIIKSTRLPEGKHAAEDRSLV